MGSASPEVLLDAAGVADTLERLADELRAALPEGVSVAVIGVRSRGEIIAERLVAALERRGLEDIETGALDITLYRDDLAELGPKATVRLTDIDFDINGRYVILVDDVLYTGRSIRAALDALVDLGRPKAIKLLVLVERPGRELPIQADLVGVRVSDPDAEVTVHLAESDGVDEVLIG